MTKQQKQEVTILNNEAETEKKEPSFFEAGEDNKALPEWMEEEGEVSLNKTDEPEIELKDGLEYEVRKLVYGLSHEPYYADAFEKMGVNGNDVYDNVNNNYASLSLLNYLVVVLKAVRASRTIKYLIPVSKKRKLIGAKINAYLNVKNLGNLSDAELKEDFKIIYNYCEWMKENNLKPKTYLIKFIKLNWLNLKDILNNEK